MRFRTPTGISDLSVAIDQIHSMRALAAYEVLVLRAHLRLKGFPKSRREAAENSLARLQLIAKGNLRGALPDGFSAPKTLSMIGVDPLLTNAEWAKQSDLVPTDGTRRVTDEVASERSRQQALGWTINHDDSHSVEDFARLALNYLSRLGDGQDRDRLLKAASVLVAGIEALDRKDQVT